LFKTIALRQRSRENVVRTNRYYNYSNLRRIRDRRLLVLRTFFFSIYSLVYLM